MIKNINEKLAKATLKVFPLVIEEEPKIEIEQQVAVIVAGQGRGREKVPVNVGVRSDYDKISPEDLIKQLREEDINITNFTSFDYKQLLVTYDTSEIIVSDDLKLELSEVLFYRYDSAKNEKYILLELYIENKVIEVFLPYLDLGIEKYTRMFNKLILDKKAYSDMKDLFYRTYTANKSNGYVGYTKQSQVPNGLTHRAGKKLAELSKGVTENCNKHGYNTFSVLLAWFSYWNTEKSSGDIRTKILGKERNHFLEFWDKILLLITII